MDASKNNVPVWILCGNYSLVHVNEEPKIYGLHLDLLPVGSKVGIMVNDVGELHYYLNGQDKGCASAGIPEGKFLHLYDFYLSFLQKQYKTLNQFVDWPLYKD